MNSETSESPNKTKVIMTTDTYTLSTSDYTYDYEDSAPCPIRETWRFFRRFAPPAYFIIFFLAFVGNVLVVHVVRRYRRSRHSPCSYSLTDTFLLHLAISDLLLAIILPLFAIQWIKGWVFGVVMCKIVGALFSLNIYCGVLFLACISFDRYLAIVHAVQTGWRRNTCLAQVTCAVIWVCCLGLSAVDIHFRTVTTLPSDGSKVCFVQFTPGTHLKWQLTMQLLNLTLGFGLPLLVMLYCYIRIFRALCSTSSRRQKKRSLRLIISLVAIFLICWAPYNAFKLTDSLLMLEWLLRSCDLEKALDIGILVTESLGLLHCALNPLLYGLVGVKFRRELVQMCKVWLGSFGLARELHSQGSSRRTTMSFSSEGENTSYFSVMS
ncbi:C-X-C chemokine receptor type 3-2 [Astyanax mexicanus]|uniref:C-X-C chemokine receptor type 3-2 n=1 Tax=Astyanax mexicanus TaxID=7994 RepID=UPI0020CAE9AB|nr:C-X-C chemokine receptor type 3-2 [Astyanax mexicanus]